MAAARRLSELLQEQQEPFLVEAATFRARKQLRRGAGRGGSGSGGCCPAAGAAAACRRLLSLCNHGFKKRRSSSIGGTGAGLRSALSKVLYGGAMRRVLRWEDLAGGCLSGAGGCGGREFRRLRRSGVGDSCECDDPRHAVVFGAEGERGRWKGDDVEVDSSRQLSPVSVLDRHSDDDDESDRSPVHCPWDDDGKPSTSGSSPPSEPFLGAASSPRYITYNLDAKFCCGMEVDEHEQEVVVSRSGTKSMEEQISSWERIAGDISRIPSIMELDVQRSTAQWQGGHRPEVTEIGNRIETLIFDDIRRETVCDMLASQCTLATPTTSC